MKKGFYSGSGTRPDERRQLPIRPRARLLRPEDYVAGDGLRDAVNVALLLRQPLLLTGEPGTGKTQLASSISWELGLGDVLKFETKSNSRARDLFYVYDALGRFQARDVESAPVNFITYGALGGAMLMSNDRESVEHLLPPDFEHGGRQQTVVLIDEVDKAPRDFPNDILNELEHLYFRMPELGNAIVRADPELLPILVITSNSEKNLPEAFLRRCVYYNIPFPDRATLSDIVSRRLGQFAGGTAPLLEQALDFFYQLREPSSGLLKRPATAELLDWLLLLTTKNPDAVEKGLDPSSIESTLSSLTKNAEDQRKATELAKRWQSPSGPR